MRVTVVGSGFVGATTAMRVAQRGLADDVVMLNTGRVVFTGSAAEVRDDSALITHHLGVF